MAATSQIIPKTAKQRRCKYCRATFVPERPQDADTAKFCCPAHRKNYWRFGGLPYDKMREQVMRDVKKMLHDDVAAAFASLSMETLCPDCKGRGHKNASTQPCNCRYNLERGATPGYMLTEFGREIQRHVDAWIERAERANRGE